MRPEPSPDQDDNVVVPSWRIRLTVNGRRQDLEIRDGQLLVEVVHENPRLTGTHIGCMNGDCGACTLKVEGRIVKSCLVLAAPVDGFDVVTIEGYAGPGSGLTPLRRRRFQASLPLPEPGQGLAASHRPG